MDVSSPYFARQFISDQQKPKTAVPVTFSYLEVDEANANLDEYFATQVIATGVWGDNDTSIIDRNTTKQYVNFRWVTAEKDVKAALFQVSRYPFPADPENWQNKYVPGIVGSGQVNEEHTRYDEDIAADYHYFRINFARAANRNPGLPPYFDGTVSLDQDNNGIGEVQQVTKVPFLNTAIITKEVSLGSFKLGLPAGLVSMASEELTQSELGNPNENLKLSCSECLNLRTFTPLEVTLSGTEQTYYVRVVPVHANGVAGKPTLPVRVNVQRPHPCPTGATSNVLINPPSAKVLSFIPTLFTPDEMYAGGPQYFVAIKDPDNCTQKSFSFSTSGSQSGGFGAGFQTTPTPDPMVYGPDSPCYGFMNAAQGKVGYHWYVPPEEESHWYDFLPDFIVDFFDALNTVVNAISLTWNMIQDFAAMMTAKIWSYLLTGGLYHCEDHPECLSVVRSGQSVALAAIGVPPTLPTYDELMDAGVEYLIQVTADELGAGEIYEGLPDEVKAEIRSGSKNFAKELVGAQSTARKNQLSESIGSWFMPDPLYNYPHPATAIVRVYNPSGNPQTTSRVLIQVTDSAGLYSPSRLQVVPPLAPGEGVAIPVVLTENYDPFMDHPETCPNDYHDNPEYPCYMWKWLVERTNKISSDTFQVSLQYPGVMPGYGDSFTAVDLKPDSDGKKLTQYLHLDSGTKDGACIINSNINYPPGWKMTLDSRTVDPNMMDSGLFSDSTTDGTIRTTCKFPEVC
jgi:hypothetical protein